MKTFFIVLFFIFSVASVGFPQPVHAGGVVDAVVSAVTNVVAIGAGVVQGSLSLVSGGSFSDGYQQGFCSVDSSSSGIITPGGCQNNSSTSAPAC